jgi:hypothetical protein
VTHTYIQAIKLPTLSYLTRSVRRTGGYVQTGKPEKFLCEADFTGFPTSMELSLLAVDFRCISSQRIREDERTKARDGENCLSVRLLQF